VRRSNRKAQLSFYSALLLLIIFPHTVFAQAPDGDVVLTENINPIPEGEAIISLFINDKYYGEAETRIELEDPFLQTKLVEEALAPQLSTSQKQRIFGTLLAKLEWLGMADLAAANISARWDIEKLSYYLTSPGEYAALRELDFTPDQEVGGSVWLKPSPIAAVINLSGSSTATISNTGTTIPVTVNADGLLNLWSLALEGNGSFSYSNSSPDWNFGSVQGIYDFPTLEGRAKGGMISSEGIGYMSRSEIFGLSIRNVDDFSRYDRNYAPSVAFSLEKPSTVRYIINGNLSRSVKMDRGNYRVYDLPFAFGLNQLELEVEDGNPENGIVIYKPLKKYITTETGLLVGGKIDYGFSAGVSRAELTEPIASAYLRYGLYSYLTTALGLQADRRSVMANIGLVSGTDLGGLIINTGTVYAWDGRSVPLSFAADADYSFALPARKEVPNFGVSFGYKSRGFNPPQPVSVVTTPDSSMKASARISGPLWRRATYGLSGSWDRVFRSPVEDTGSISFNIGLSTLNNFSLNISTSLSLSSQEKPDFSLGISLSTSDPIKSGRSIRYSQTDDGRTSIGYSDQIPLMGGINYTLQGNNLIGGVSEISSIGIGSGIDGRVFSLNGSGRINWGGTLSSPNGVVNLNASTALSFAGGSFAISKPLRDSFIIFDPDKSTGSMPVAFAINSGTKQTSRGGAIAQSLSSYSKVLASMDFPEADADVTATVPQIALATGYRTGFVYRAGLEKRMYVTGRLLDAEGFPVSLIAGDVEKTDGSYFDFTFTDEEGNFQAYGLTSGEYKIHWPDYIGVSLITLGPDEDGLVELGDIAASPVAEEGL
jgi:outer membrane usher protein